MIKNFLFEISHPKHYYQFRYLIEQLGRRHDVSIIARDKDMVIDLIKASGLPYQQYGLHGKNIYTKLLFTPRILFDYLRIVMKAKPDIIISKASPYAAIIAPIVKAKTIIMPDDEVVALTNKLVAPLSTYIVTPSNFTLEYGSNHYRVNGLFEEAYLHQKHFIPDPKILELLGVNEGELFFVLRFVGWFANHDVGKYGFSNRQKINLVRHLSKTGKVFISSEGSLPGELESYRLHTPSEKIHHILYFAHLYVGDSQSMATEAALLGTPSIRYNSFVGENDMSNFKLLEEKHGMIINTKNFKELMNSIQNLLSAPNETKQEWVAKRKRYFSGKVDVNLEMSDILHNLKYI
jgi:predicted glycosyltransferase